MYLRMCSAAIILLAAGFLGCQGEKALPPHEGSGATPAADPATITPMETPPASTPVAPTAAAPPAGAAIATTDGEKPGLTVRVTELKRGSGGTTTLRFTIVNGSDTDMGFGYDFAESGAADYSTVAGVHLIDPVAKKKYLVVRDSSSGKCVCSQGLGSVKQGSQMNLWSKFPSPPADVQRVTVVIPHFAPMDDVPIS